MWIFCQENMYRFSGYFFSVFFLLLICTIPAMALEQGFSEGYLGYGPSYVKDTIPDRLQPGHSYPVMITFRNGGLVNWERKNHRVGLVYAGNLTEVVGLPAFVDIPEKSVIPPGNAVTFATSLLPVGLPGQYHLPFYVSYRTALGDQQVTEVWTKTVTIVPTDGVSSPVNGSIVVESASDDLTVSLGDVPMGVTPCIIPDINPGKYNVLVKNNGSERHIPVTVERGTISRIYISNTSAEPTIEFKKINVVSDGTLFGYIEANVPLVILVVVFVFGCIVLMIHGVRLRREKEAVDKEKIRKKGRGKRQDDEDDPAQLEKDLLDKYHDHPPLFEGGSPGADPGSGSAYGKMKTDTPPVPMKNVRKFSREMLDGSQDDPSGGLQGSAGRDSLSSDPQGVDVDISFKTLDVRSGFATAHFAASNQSAELLSIEGTPLGPGGFAEISVDVEEPVSDEYEMILTLKILSEKGQENPLKILIPYNRGIALLARGVIEKAYEYFHLIIRKNPGNRDALLHQVDVLMKWGLEDEAAAVLSQILALYPDDSEAHEAINKIAVRKAQREKNRINDVKPKISGFPDSLDERYTPIRLLGKDAFASIVLVLRKDTGDLRVLKIAHADAGVSSTLYTEISVLYQLRHPNVLKMFRAEFNPSLFLELEYVSGIPCNNTLCRTLADLPHPVHEEMILTLIDQIAMGLAYMHMKGVRHYKFSPKHILLDDPMTPKISGFIRESLPIDGAGKQEKNFALAPEQILPEKFGKLGKRTDIFQMGVVWYWLMTGKVPFPDGAVSSTQDGGYVAGVYLSPGMINPRFSMYDPLMRRLLALEKRERYGSVDEFLAELRGLQLVMDDKGIPSEENDK